MKRSEVDINKISPMMRQYMEIRDTCGDALLLFRLGDFYELFFEDAEVAASVLEIALTGKKCGLEERVPMAGVPHHAANMYIGRLIEAGFKVAICEQVEEAGASKGIVKREIVQIVTGGTLMNNDMLTSDSNNYIGAITSFGSGYNIAYADLSTGAVYTTVCKLTDDALISLIMLYDIKELVVLNDFDQVLSEKLQKEYGRIVSTAVISDDKLMKNLYKHIKDDRYTSSIKLLFEYLISVSKKEIDHLKKVIQTNNNDFLRIDYSTKRNLELTQTLKLGTKENSLLSVLDQTKTALGARMLRSWLISPLTDIDLINERYDMIDNLSSEFIVKDELKLSLTRVYDLERIISRIAYGNASAKDLLQLKNSLMVFPQINDQISKIKFKNKLKDLHETYYLLERGIDDEATHSMRDGNIIKYGFNDELDELRDIKKDSKNYLIKFEQEERERTGIKNLKIGYNKIFGYYIEITKGSLHLLDEEWGYERKQTLANAERFITPILKEKENTILRSEERMAKLEVELFLEIRAEVKKQIDIIQYNADIIATLDALISLTDVSAMNGYVRPELTTDRIIEVKDGRHPVVERVISGEYVPNDIIVNEKEKIFIITGPNMSGKSTYLRQIAVMAIMAQMGCFVPAARAKLPIFDEIFTRIGASDDLVSGESTFMVEMLEANRAILNATKNSLILFDELGRGTATFDGMSLAYAIIEYISKEIGCITYFSTHYHELTDLAGNLDNVANIHVQAEIVNKELIFKHKIEQGSVDKSYGIYVAKLANLPSSLVKRAAEVLSMYEAAEKKEIEQLTIADFTDDNNNAVIDKLKAIDINALTPIAALNLVAEITEEIE